MNHIKITCENGYSVSVSMVNGKPFITVNHEDEILGTSSAQSTTVGTVDGKLQFVDWHPTVHPGEDNDDGRVTYAVEPFESPSGEPMWRVRGSNNVTVWAGEHERIAQGIATDMNVGWY